jgi:hypothetical protein
VPGRRLRRQQRQRLRALRRTTAILLGDDARLAAQADAVAAALRAANPIDEVLYLWEMERVTTLAVHRARELGVEHDAWSARAEERRREAEMRATFDDLALDRLAKTFEGAGIPLVVLKGTPMARRLHGAAGLRARSSDVDILVPTADLFRSAELLTGAGWHPPKDAIYTDGLPQHHLELVGAPPRPNVEVHWRVQWFDPAAADEARMLDRRQEVDGIPVPAPVDQLVVLLHSWSRDGFHALRLGADVAAWWRVFGASEGARAFEHLAASPASRSLLTSAVIAAELFGVPAPPAAPSDRRTRFALGIAMADRPQRERTTYSQVALVDQLICPVPLRRDRLRMGLLRAPELLRVRYPRVPARAIGGMRILSAVRTLSDWVPLSLQALRAQRGPRSPR